MSGLAIYFPRTPASKRMPSSPSPSAWPSKRRRLSPITGTSTAPGHSPTKMNWHTVYLQPNSSLNPTSPPSPTEFVTPPDGCELACSPSPSQSSWVHVVPASSSSASENQDSGGSTIFSGSSLDLVPTIMSFPNPPFHGEHTPSPSVTVSPSSHASSEACTPAKVPCPSTCFCQLDVQLDTFGNRSDVERVQLTQKISPTHDGSAVSRMLFPRSTWSLFRTFSSDNVLPRTKHFVYRDRDNRGRAVTVENEDLWMDEKNPFLLTRFDLRQENFKGMVIPTTSSLNLL